jgi:para-aminobenzoate synthetase/4-amino-4-deoxychorismate lyase
VFNVPIRTVALRGGEGQLGVGSGVVWDSEAEAGYAECLLKARFLLEATPDRVRDRL